MEAEDITLNDLFNDNGIAGFLQELKADKDLASINIDCLLNVNRVLPVGYPQFIYFFGETFGKLRETGAFKRFFELASKYHDTLSKLANMQLIFRKRQIYPCIGRAAAGSPSCGARNFLILPGSHLARSRGIGFELFPAATVLHPWLSSAAMSGIYMDPNYSQWLSGSG